jgi:hypothetical protein
LIYYHNEGLTRHIPVSSRTLKRNSPEISSKYPCCFIWSAIWLERYAWQSLHGVVALFSRKNN